MSLTTIVVLGGVGIFLIGMVALTQGLKALAGSSLRNFLAHFTTTPLRGAAAGALSTAIVQSSSATTVTAVGFVGAGLLSFPQALGIVFGANIGTTVTGWLVAIFGFKLELSLVAQPLIFVGALLRLFGRGRIQHLGWALAGFGLLFVGIDMMKAGMTDLKGIVTPNDFPDDTLIGRLQLILIGIAITLVTQSSSAGVATALVALAAGAISFQQAAAMVIGMDVGTTFTAALATIGGSTATRRTGYAHVIYNLMTAIMAYLLLDPYAAILEFWGSESDPIDSQIALVGFHTAFNTLGTLLILPFAGQFAHLVERLIPEKGPPLLRRLDDRLLKEPEVTVDAAVATVQEITHLSVKYACDALGPPTKSNTFEHPRATLTEAIEATRLFLDKIETRPKRPIFHRRLVATMHLIDHLLRVERRMGQAERIQTLRTDQRLLHLSETLKNSIALLADGDLYATERELDRVRTMLRNKRRDYRLLMFEEASTAGMSAEVVLQKLDALRWLHRVSYHYWRISHHLREIQDPNRPAATDEKLLADIELDDENG